MEYQQYTCILEAYYYLEAHNVWASSTYSEITLFIDHVLPLYM